MSFVTAVLTFSLLFIGCQAGELRARKWKIEGCGKSKYADAGELFDLFQIIGGTTARPNEFPWQVDMEFHVGTGIFICSAIVISEEWLITAAHCAIDRDGNPLPPGNFTFLPGQHYYFTYTEIVVGASEVFVHPNYDFPIRFDNDIALIHLDQALPFNENISQICPPRPEEIYEGKKLTISGWGTTESSFIAEYLQYANIDAIANSQCAALYAPTVVTDNMICHWDPTNQTDSCQGDSGGPAAYKNPSDGCFELVGMTSWGFGCAAGRPGVNVRVSRYLNWIEQQ